MEWTIEPSWISGFRDVCNYKIIRKSLKHLMHFFLVYLYFNSHCQSHRYVLPVPACKRNRCWLYMRRRATGKRSGSQRLKFHTSFHGLCTTLSKLAARPSLLLAEKKFRGVLAMNCLSVSQNNYLVLLQCAFHLSPVWARQDPFLPSSIKF